MSNYLISIGKNKNRQNVVIHDPETKLKVKATDLVRSKFKPSEGEVQYFVTAGNKKIAFETEGYNNHRKLHILTMIAQCCVYLGLIEAQIHANLPSLI